MKKVLIVMAVIAIGCSVFAQRPYRCRRWGGPHYHYHRHYYYGGGYYNSGVGLAAGITGIVANGLGIVNNLTNPYYYSAPVYTTPIYTAPVYTPPPPPPPVVVPRPIPVYTPPPVVYY